MTSKTGTAFRYAVAALIVAAVAYAVLRPLAPMAPAPDPRITGEIQHFSVLRNPRTVDDAAFRAGDGTERSLRDLRGKVVLVNFWATWCAPCVKELPSLAALQKRLGGDRFMVLALNEDRSGAAAAKPFLERLGLDNLGVYTDPGGAAQRALGVSSLPTTILLDGKGRELGRLVGPAEWDSDEAVDLITHYMRRMR